MTLPVPIREADSLPDLFLRRVAATPDGEACAYHEAGQWHSLSWRQLWEQVGRWQVALKAEGLVRGDRVAIMLKNSPEWLAFDLAALGLGLVTVPLYVDDRPENVAHILAECEARLLVVGRHNWWQALEEAGLPDSLRRGVCAGTCANKEGKRGRLQALATWLPEQGEEPVADVARRDLATLAYTSGTTGRPKGVMLTHGNVLANVEAAASLVSITEADRFLSFLPLSHMLERMAGMYLPIACGASVSYARSINQLGEDLASQRPTVLISVPRIYEKAWHRLRAMLKAAPPIKRGLFDLALKAGQADFAYRQGRAGWRPLLLLAPLLRRLVGRKVMARFGGRLRFAVCGGAPLSPKVSYWFVGLGLPLLQGYGLTEASPVVCVNRPDNNLPESVGPALPGIEIRLGPKQELWLRGDNVMRGYWQNKVATEQALDADGWLHTGDQARIDERGRVFITGRLKEIIVLSSGEKVSPADMELAIQTDSAFEQVMVVGEGRGFLTAIAVLSEQEAEMARDQEKGLEDPAHEKALLARINATLSDLPRHARIRRLILTDQPWTVEAGLLTPTLKLRRPRIEALFEDRLQAIFEAYD